MDAVVGDHVLLKSEVHGAIWQITQIDEPPSAGTITGRLSSTTTQAYTSLFSAWHPTVHVTLVLPPSGWAWSDVPPVRCVYPVNIVPINEVEVFARMANWLPMVWVALKPIANPRRILPPDGFTVRSQRVWRHQHRGAA